MAEELEEKQEAAETAETKPDQDDPVLERLLAQERELEKLRRQNKRLRSKLRRHREPADDSGAAASSGNGTVPTELPSPSPTSAPSGRPDFFDWILGRES